MYGFLELDVIEAEDAPTVHRMFPVCRVWSIDAAQDGCTIVPASGSSFGVANHVDQIREQIRQMDGASRALAG